MAMMFDKVNRRTHLYLGILLAPWFLLYAASSIFLNHGGWFQQARSQEPPWTKVFERDYRLPPFNDDADQWALAEKILKDFGMEVDTIALATLVWIASGLYLWVKLKRLRYWGWVALASGCASFLLVVIGM
jgi:hypothetical protein